MFKLRSGAQVKKIFCGVEKDATTLKDVIFTKEDVLVDPVGNLGWKSIKSFLKNDFLYQYAFLHKNRVIVAHVKDVEYFD